MTMNQMTAQNDSAVTEIWCDFLRTKSESLRNTLMVHYQFMVRTVAQRISRKLPQQVDVDDLVQYGMFGLRDAIYSFDLKRKVRFETYCIRRIRGAIFDGLRTLTWAPRDIRRTAAEIQKIHEQLKMQSGKEPSEEQIARRLSIPVEQYRQMARQASKISLLSMNQQLPGASRAIELEDHVEPRPEEIAQRSDIRDLLTKELSRQERLILMMYYYEHMNMRQIGEVLGITESRVSQMHSQILTLLKTRFEPRLNDAAGTRGITVNL